MNFDCAGLLPLEKAARHPYILAGESPASKPIADMFSLHLGSTVALPAWSSSSGEPAGPAGAGGRRLEAAAVQRLRGVLLGAVQLRPLVTTEPQRRGRRGKRDCRGAERYRSQLTGIGWCCVNMVYVV
jgi:hypothetical protein